MRHVKRFIIPFCLFLIALFFKYFIEKYNLVDTGFFEKPFQNWTRTTSEILGTVFLYTDYHVSFDALRNELTRLLKSTPLWDGKVNVLQVTDAQPNSVKVRALMSAKDSAAAWDLRVFIREKLIEFLQKNYPESLPKTRILVENQPSNSER